MAKSKLLQINKNIEKAVVGGYKKIETTVTGSFTKLEDRFVDNYLTHEGETVEQAKIRLNNENQNRRSLHEKK